MSFPQPPIYYEILQISPQTIEEVDSQHGPEASHNFIKRAYRRALLSHHPDKQQNESSTTTTAPPKYTIDQISLAYATLSTPSQRASYDRQLQTHSTSGTTTLFQTGIENVDLDDLSSFEEESTSLTKWFAPCRCGNSHGFMFSEDDLEDAADLGELMVGCADCSLWLRVHFAVAEEEEEEEEKAREQKGCLDGSCCGSSSRTTEDILRGLNGS